MTVRMTHCQRWFNFYILNVFMDYPAEILWWIAGDLDKEKEPCVREDITNGVILKKGE